MQPNNIMIDNTIMEFKMKKTIYICPVLDCNAEVSRVDNICREHRIMKNKCLKCDRKGCTNKRHEEKNHCEHCSQKIASLYYELNKAPSKCQDIVSSMNNKYNLNYKMLDCRIQNERFREL